MAMTMTGEVQLAAPREAVWQADGEFVPGSDEDGGGRWTYTNPVPREGWPLAWNDVAFTAQCTPFRHLGFFPDMAPVWDWMGERLEGRSDAAAMNLFGYTGMMSLAAAHAGAEVVHLDASAKSIAFGRENQALSGLEDRTIRWICDDAMKFVEREIRRGRRYDAIVLDPPK
jgi:23S rRNA (cytosine1962-C5)-methyltransferase